jgi:hypothetical protein
VSFFSLTDLRELADVDLAAAKALRIGGESWQVFRLQGSGTTSPKVRENAGYVTGYLVANEPTSSRGSDAGQPAAATGYSFTRLKGLALRLGDELEGDGAACRLGPKADELLTEQWEATRL